MFIDTRLDVPEEYFKVPFPSFVILFPENHGIESLCDDAGRPLRSIIVDNSEGKILIAIDGKDPEHIRQTVLWIDFGERVLLSDSPYISDIPEETRQIPGFDKAALPIYNYQLLKFKAGDTIETALDRQRKNHDPRFPLAVKAIEACVRMACAVCFLATGADKIIEPDILSKDLQRYLNDRENPEAVERLHGRARKRGKNGWTVGREYLFPSLPSSSDGDSESTGRHLKHQHQRRPHFHVVRHGSGKQLAKVVWFNQITVRPDLAPPTNKVRKGFVAK